VQQHPIVTLTIPQPFTALCSGVELSDWAKIAWATCGVLRELSMTPSEEFRKLAVECSQMSKFSRDRKSKAEWTTIAERYLRCAAWYESRQLMRDQIRQKKVHNNMHRHTIDTGDAPRT
jgi:hypothetical protein